MAAGVMAMLGTALTAVAQAPATIAGGAVLIKVTSGTSPLPTSGYQLFVPATTGDAYQLIGIYNGLADVGNYSYSLNGSTNGQVSLVDTVDGLQATVNLGYAGPNQGAYKLASTFPSGYTQAGTFMSALGSTPGSFAGRIFTGTVNAGLAPFATGGTFTMTFATSGNAYTITGGAGNSSGTYTLLLINRSTMAVNLTDTRTSTNTMYLSFGTAVSGLFMIAQATTTGGYEVGTFTASDNTPPHRGDPHGTWWGSSAGAMRFLRCRARRMMMWGWWRCITGWRGRPGCRRIRGTVIRTGRAA